MNRGNILKLMNKLVIIVVAVLVLALLGYFGYMQMQKGGTNPIQQAVEQTSESVTKGTIKSLLGANKNVTCKTTAKDQSGSGTIFVAGSKMRGDFSSQVEGKSMMTHMIQDDEFAYMWSDEDSRGTKFKIDVNQPEPSLPAGSSVNSKAENLDDEVDMNCSSWIPDGSKFKPPGEVQFTDLSKMMENTKIQNKTGTTAPKVDSSICDQIEDADAKAQCLNALGN